VSLPEGACVEGTRIRWKQKLIPNSLPGSRQTWAVDDIYVQRSTDVLRVMLHEKMSGEKICEEHDAGKIEQVRVVSVVFNGEVRGFEAADVLVVGGTILDLTQVLGKASSEFIFELKISAIRETLGFATVRIPSDVCTNLLGNPNRCFLI